MCTILSSQAISKIENKKCSWHWLAVLSTWWHDGKKLLIRDTNCEIGLCYIKRDFMKCYSKCQKKTGTNWTIRQNFLSCEPLDHFCIYYLKSQLYHHSDRSGTMVHMRQNPDMTRSWEHTASMLMMHINWIVFLAWKFKNLIATSKASSKAAGNTVLLYIEYYRLAFSYFTSKGASAVLIVLKL